MKKIIDLYNRLQKFDSRQEGVFTFNELAVLFDINDSNSLNKKIKVLIDYGYIKKFIRGFYVTDKFNVELLSRKINPDSYTAVFPDPNG